MVLKINGAAKALHLRKQVGAQGAVPFYVLENRRNFGCNRT
jgi:hypothetical protein